MRAKSYNKGPKEASSQAPRRPVAASSEPQEREPTAHTPHSAGPPYNFFLIYVGGAAQRCPKTPLSPGLFCVLSHSQSLQLWESPGTMPPKCAIERPRPASASALRPAACCTLRPICIHASAVWRCGGVSRRWSSPRPPTDTSRGKRDAQSLLRRSIGVCFWSQEVLARQAPHRPPRRR